MNIIQQNEKLFEYFINEIETIKLDNNFNDKEISEMLATDQDYINSVLSGDISKFTPALWIRSTSRIGVDSQLINFIREVENGDSIY